MTQAAALETLIEMRTRWRTGAGAAAWPRQRRTRSLSAGPHAPSGRDHGVGARTVRRRPRGATGRATRGIDSSAAPHPNPQSFEQGQDALGALLMALPSQLRRTDPLVILGGFSQGGTSSLAFMMRNPGRVHAVLVFSGFLADHPSVAVTARAGAQHADFLGTRHRRYAPSRTPRRKRVGRSSTRPVPCSNSRSYRGMSHTISEEEMRDAKRWLATLLPDANTNGAP